MDHQLYGYLRSNPGPSPKDRNAIYKASERYAPPPDWTLYNHTRRRFSGDSTDYSLYDENMEQPTMYRRRFSDPIIKPITGNELEPTASKQPRVYESRHLIIEKPPKPPKPEKPKEPILKFPRYYEFSPPPPDPRFYNVGVLVPLTSLSGQFKPVMAAGYSWPAVYNQVFEYRPQSLPLSYF